jgi:hypothetical protein
MRKTIYAATAALALAASPALAGGNSASLSLDLGLGGNAGIEGAIEGGSYALGRNGSDAFARSTNRVETFGLSDVGKGWSSNYGVSSSNGWSVAETSGQGSRAEAFETRALSFDNFSRFNADFEANARFRGFRNY